VGKFYGKEVYDAQGKYMGEVIKENRLISDSSKKFFVKPSFAPYARRVGYAKFADYAGYAMYAGYHDFPS
jgi:hypothetical protein